MAGKRRQSMRFHTEKATRRSSAAIRLTKAALSVTLCGVAKLSDTLQVINDLVAERVVLQYAIGGAMAMLFWAEPTVTFDLDVFILLPVQASPILSLAPIYDALHGRGFDAVSEHIVIHGIPVQFRISPNPLSDEAIVTAVERDLDGVTFRVIRPEYLAALWLQAGGAKRRERVEMLRQAGVLDEAALQALLRTFAVVV